jgi:hypothetical protein
MDKPCRVQMVQLYLCEEKVEIFGAFSLFFICDTLTLLHVCIDRIGDKSCFSLCPSTHSLNESRYENTVVSNAYLTRENIN